MASMDEQILKVTKEIVVKFIEVGRISPASFAESFRNIHKTISSSVRELEKSPEKTNKN